MRVSIRLFAMLRQQAGWRDRAFDLPAGASVEDAWRALVGLHPELRQSRSVVRFALNGAYTASDTPLRDGDELAIIPPVAGGAEEPLARLELREEPIDDELLRELRAAVPTTSDGALVIFLGQTRETPGTPAPGQEAEAERHAGAAVTALEYEAFAEMALRTFGEIAAEVGQRFGVHRVAILHRVGRVPLAEPSVVVAAAAPHRGAAFDACRYTIDELKARAPIWKSEEYTDGSVWIGQPARESASPRSDGADGRSGS